METEYLNRHYDTSISPCVKKLSSTHATRAIFEDQQHAKHRMFVTRKRVGRAVIGLTLA